jgi:hypothetical protein
VCVCGKEGCALLGRGGGGMSTIVQHIVSYTTVASTQSVGSGDSREEGRGGGGPG